MSFQRAIATSATRPALAKARRWSGALLFAGLSLCALPVLAQMNTIPPGGSPRLRPIPDEALAGLKSPQLRLGETQLDWRAFSPRSRAELIQVLASRRHTLQLLAWDGQGDRNDPASLRLDASTLQLADPTQARWWFGLKNDGRQARRARWQLSRFPFDDNVDNWRAPTGMLAGGEILPLPTGRLPDRFDVDLGRFLFGGAPSDSRLPTAVALTSMLHPQYPVGTIYLRAVGIGRNGSLVGLPSPSLRIDLQPLSKGGALDSAALPEVSVTAFQAYRPATADARCWVQGTRAVSLAPPQSVVEGAPLVVDEGQTLPPTQPINLCDPANSTILHLVGDGFGSSEALADRMRHWARQRMEIASEAVRTETQRNYGGLTAACTSECRQAITLVLEQVVAAIGGPPDSAMTPSPLPEAAGYLEQLMVDAFKRHSDLGEAFEADAARQAGELFLRMMQSVGNAVPPSFEPFQERQQRQPRLHLRLQADAPSAAGWLQLRELGRKPRLHPTLLPIPPLQAGQPIDIPLQLAVSEPADVSALQLPPQADLTAAAGDPAALLQLVSTHLSRQGKQVESLQKPLRRGRYRIELAWRDASGGYSRIGVATCRADRDDSCKLKR